MRETSDHPPQPCAGRRLPKVHWSEPGPKAAVLARWVTCRQTWRSHEVTEPNPTLQIRTRKPCPRAVGRGGRRHRRRREGAPTGGRRTVEKAEATTEAAGGGEWRRPRRRVETKMGRSGGPQSPFVEKACAVGRPTRRLPSEGALSCAVDRKWADCFGKRTEWRWRNTLPTAAMVCS